MNYCSDCGSQRIEVTVPEGDRFERYCCADCGRIHYINPRMIVGCLAVWDGRILLCRRDIEPRSGLWNLPAGFLELRECAEDGARRETFEEANAEVDIQRLHCVYNLPHANQVYLHFLAHIKRGLFSAGEETSDAQLFAPDEIPWDEIAFTSSTFAIERYLQYPDQGEVHIGRREMG